MSDLTDLFAFSYLLAKRWQAFTPEMGLAWNPHDPDEVVQAAQCWLMYVSENLFPLAIFLADEPGDMLEALEYIFPDMMGFDPDETDTDELQGVDRLFFQMWAAHESYSAEDTTEIRAMGITRRLEELHRGLDEWLAGGCLPETERDMWEGCLCLLDYYRNSTGTSYLDIPSSEMYSGGYAMVHWTAEGVARIKEDWQMAQEIQAKMEAFRRWARDDERYEYVVSVLQEINEELDQFNEEIDEFDREDE